MYDNKWPYFSSIVSNYPLDRQVHPGPGTARCAASTSRHCRNDASTRVCPRNCSWLDRRDCPIGRSVIRYAQERRSCRLGRLLRPETDVDTVLVLQPVSSVCAVVVLLSPSYDARHAGARRKLLPPAVTAGALKCTGSARSRAFEVWSNVGRRRKRCRSTRQKRRIFAPIAQRAHWDNLQRPMVFFVSLMCLCFILQPHTGSVWHRNRALSTVYIVLRVCDRAVHRAWR